MKIKDILKFMAKRKDCPEDNHAKSIYHCWQIKYITILKLNQILDEIEDFKKEIDKRTDVNLNE